MSRLHTNTNDRFLSRKMWRSLSSLGSASLPAVPDLLQNRFESWDIGQFEIAPGVARRQQLPPHQLIAQLGAEAASCARSSDRPTP